MAEEDQELLTEFLDENLENLAGIPDLFIQVEKNPEDKDILNAIFRPVHTLKGSSAFFGLMKVKELAHAMETVMDRLRNLELQVSRDIIDVMLEGVDSLNSMLDRVRNSEAEVTDEASFIGLFDRVVQASSGGRSAEENAWADLKRLMEKLLDSPVFEDEPKETRYINELHTLLGVINPEYIEGDEVSIETPPIVSELMSLLQEPLEGVMEDSKSKRVLECFTTINSFATTDSAREILEKGIDDYNTMVMALGFEPLLQDALRECLEKYIKTKAWPAEEESTQLETSEQLEAEGQTAGTEKPPSSGASPEKKSGVAKPLGKSMRIPEETIDTFLSNVGELIVVREMFEYLRRRFEEMHGDDQTSTEFRRLNEAFTTVSSNLEKNVMNIRKVTVKGLLQKVPRIIRDIAKKSGKEIEVVTEGEDVQIDKSLVESLEGPLVHMTRNSADHGVELPDDREAKGKGRQGRVSVIFEEFEESITMTIKDDGKGLDLAAIKDKAVSLGLVKENQEMTEKDIIDFLFQSGVSTAKEVTDVSGRGVGMDVVKKSIDAAGGKISVQTEEGVGSTFSISLPKSVTTQIIDGFVVSVCGNHYVIPVKNIVESFPPTVDLLINVYDKDECIKRQGAVLPMVRLTHLFHNSDDKSFDAGILIVIDNAGTRFAVLVDSIIGIQQVVLKPLTGLYVRNDYFSGGALMGDGGVSLILDIEKLGGASKEEQEAS